MSGGRGDCYDQPNVAADQGARGGGHRDCGAAGPGMWRTTR